MSKNILIENKRYLYYANHYVNDKGEPMTRTELKTNGYQFICFTVVFCPNCKKMHPVFKTFQKNGEFIYKEESYPMSFYQDDRNPLILNWRVEDEFLKEMVCPSCGEDLTKYPLNILEKKSVNSNNSRTIKSMKIFDPEDDKLIASIFLAYYYPNTNGGKLAIIPVRHRLVFNYKTGKTYFLQGRDLSGKHPKFDSSPEIFNATLGAEMGCCPEISAIIREKQIVSALAEELIKVHNGKKEQLTKVGDFSDTSFSMLTIYNNIPYFNYDFYYMASKTTQSLYFGDRKPRDRFTYKLRTLNERYSEGDPKVFEKYLFKGTSLEIKKSIKRELFANPLLADYYKLLVRSGFKNHDIIRSFLTKNLDFLMSYKKVFEEERAETQKCMLDFIKALIKSKGEAETCKALLSFKRSDCGSYLKDTALMYAVFLKRKMFKKEYFKGDLGKIHDILAKDYKKIKEPNVKIEYDKKYFDLNDKINEFVFSLAEDTYELIDIGQEMHICVGSYGKRAANGKLIIVKMMQGNQYVGCIELSSNGKELKQAKACFNNRLEEKKAEALREWVEKHKIETRYCYDYSHIASNNISYDEDKIYQGHHDYANYYQGDIQREAQRILFDDDNDWLGENNGRAVAQAEDEYFPF